MLTSLTIEQALIVQFNVNGHHKWATCPICLHVGPQKERVLAHLNEHHTLPGYEFALVEAHDRQNPLNTFWVAVSTFDPARVKRSTPTQDKKALEAMKKADGLGNILPKEVFQRMEFAIEESRREQRAKEKSAEKKPADLVKKKKPFPMSEKVKEAVKSVGVKPPKKARKSKSKSKKEKKK